jgi:hypothetical protein
VQRPEPEDEAESREDVFDPVVAESSHIEQDDQRCGRRERERRQDQGPYEKRVAGHVEALAEPIQRRKHEQAQRSFLDVEAFREMRDRQPDDEPNRELPRATAPARQRAREPDERQPEGERQDARGARKTWGQHAAHEVRAVGELGCERRGDAGGSHRCGGPTEHELPAKSAKPHAGQGTCGYG